MFDDLIKKLYNGASQFDDSDGKLLLDNIYYSVVCTRARSLILPFMYTDEDMHSPDCPSTQVQLKDSMTFYLNLIRILLTHVQVVGKECVLNECEYCGGKFYFCCLGVCTTRLLLLH